VNEQFVGVDCAALVRVDLNEEAVGVVHLLTLHHSTVWSACLMLCCLFKFGQLDQRRH
jgi:hypothetical protein